MANRHTNRHHERFKSIVNDLGKATKRGVRKCPACGTVNGTRGLQCKNLHCDHVFKESQARKKGAVGLEGVRVHAGGNVQVYSVRVRERGPEARGFVQLPQIQTSDGLPADLTDPEILLPILVTHGKCLVETCQGNMQRQANGCQHIRAAIDSVGEAQPLSITSDALQQVSMDSEARDIISREVENSCFPVVQRVSREVCVVQCDATPYTPLGLLHLTFSKTGHKYFCACRTYNLTKASRRRPCIHFIKCMVSLFGESESEEIFERYYHLLDASVRVAPVALEPEVIISADAVIDDHENDAFLNLHEAQGFGDEGADDAALHVMGTPMDSLTSSLVDNGFTNVEVIVEHIDEFAQQLSSKTDVVTLQPVDTELHCMDTQLHEDPLASMKDEQEVSSVSTYSTLVRTTDFDQRRFRTRQDRFRGGQDLELEEDSCQLMFIDWLSNITERMNEAMHFQLNGSPDPIVAQAPHAFFDCLQNRISANTKRKLLPNTMTTIHRHDTPPLGSFTQYAWLITNIVHVKQIFDTSLVQLQVRKCFVENKDGSYSVYDESARIPEPFSIGGKNLPIRPFQLKTFLKVGVPSDEDPTVAPLIIEWTPNLFPQTQFGEVIIRFQFGHERNGRIERRTADDAQQ